jgi:MFS family permease
VANVGPLGIPAVASLIRADLGLTLAQAGSFLSAYYIGPSLVSLQAGTLADRWGVKRVLVLGQLVIALGLVAASTATSYVALVLLLVAAGFGYGMLNPTSTKAVSLPGSPSWRDRGPPALRWVWVLAVSSAGVTLGSLAFGYVVQVAGGYRGPWIVLAATMVVAVAGLFAIGERKPGK